MKLDIKKLEKWLQDNYFGNTKIEISLIRSYTNDVYLVVTDNNKFVLKIYGRDWRDLDSIKWEVDLVNHLNSKDVLVPKVIKDKIGNHINTFNNHFCVLSEFAAGTKPQSPFSMDQYFLFGKTIGIFHNESDDFKSPFKRRDIDLDYLINNPVKLASSFLKSDQELTEMLLDASGSVKRKIVENSKGLDWGPVHGDATFDNLHFTEDNKVVLYDFDSGGMGWRASDLQGWAIGNKDFGLKHDAFIDGYKSVRNLNNIDIEMSPYITTAWEIWGLEVELNNRIINKGEAEVQKYLAKQIQVISDLADKL